MGSFSIWHWLVVLAVVLLLFGGGGKISRLMGDFGKGLKNFKGDSALSTWLYRVGVNCCLNQVAAKRPSTESIDDAQYVDERLDDPLRAVVRGERVAEVRRAIAQLPPKQRATLLLRVYQELSHDEIATILGCSVGAAKANFFHALRNLKRLLQP